jgi:N-acyl homoserine lactone hydrolase
MTVDLYALTCGHLTIPRAFMLDGTEGSIKVPVPSYLIVHPKGTAVFDSGLHVDAQADALGYAGEFLFGFHDFHFAAGEEVRARLESIDVDPRSVDLVVNSHLHFDHSGGNAQLSEATVVVQRREWEHAHSDDVETKGYITGDFDTGQDVRLVDGEHDLFGDGSVVIIPSYGHTPGHQSVRVRIAAGEFLLCGDACYLRQSLDDLHLPGVIADPAAARATLLRFRELRAAGTQIMFGHDPDFWRTVPQAPAVLARRA